MSETLTERLKRRAEQQRLTEQSEQDAVAFQARVNAFISERAQAEYDTFLLQLKERLPEVNAELADLPPYQWQGMMLAQGNCVASLAFTQPIVNRPNNQLIVGIGTHPHAQYFFDARPEPLRYRFHAAANDELSGIVWTDGGSSEMSSAELVDFVLEQLGEYYLEHKPRRH